jgi:hypothetical protein
MELSEHMVDFEKRSDIKSQVLADFIADWMEPSSYTEGTVVDMLWQVYCRAWGFFGAGSAVTIGHKAEVCGTTVVHSRGRQVQQRHSRV